MGYLHRGVEKQAEEGTYLHLVTATDRLDYLSAMNNNWALALAVERLAGIPVPERAEYIRVIIGELQRIASHCVAIGTFGSDVGAFFTPLLYTFREREAILDLFNMVCGARLTYSYIRPGGVALDLTDEFVPACRTFADQMPARVDEYEALLTSNEVFVARTKGVGILKPDLAVDYSISGPNLRGSGVRYDLRRDAPYSVYERFEFDVPVGTVGDCFDRYMVRVHEMRESVKIIKQALDQLPGGPHATPVNRNLRPPAGEAFSRLESPRGELGFYLVSDGSIAPYRAKIRAPSFINIGPLREMLVGWKVADVIAILGSIDIVLGEVDR
jgi:NADH-quinone oxidoreductase subunit D